MTNLKYTMICLLYWENDSYLVDTTYTSISAVTINKYYTSEKKKCMLFFGVTVNI